MVDHYVRAPQTKFRELEIGQEFDFGDVHRCKRIGGHAYEIVKNGLRYTIDDIDAPVFHAST